jgi:NifU-like protein involved in Fe-S cluster formation
MAHQDKDRKPADAGEKDVEARLRENYSERAVDHMLHPRGMNRLNRPDGYVRTETENGETIEFFIRLDGETLAECTFQTTACAATLAYASAAAELAQDQHLRDVLAVVTSERILRELDGLPEGNVPCSGHVVAAFREAVADAMRHSAEPWKKLYRKT